MPLPNFNTTTRFILRPDQLAPGITEFTAGIGGEDPALFSSAGDAYFHRVFYPEHVNFDVDGTLGGNTGFRYATFPGLVDVGSSSAPVQDSVGLPLELETLTAVAFRVQRRVEYAPTAAIATLLSTGTTPTNGDTVTLDAKTYTARTALTPTEGEVLIDGSAPAFLLNLSRAVRHTGTPGTDYSAAAAHPTISAAATVDSYPDGTYGLNLTALTAGPAGNALASTDTATGLSFAFPTFTGGSDTTFPPALKPLGGTVRLVLENGLLPGGSSAEVLMEIGSPGLFLLTLEEPWTPESGAAFALKFDPPDLNAVATLTLCGFKPV